LQFGIIVAALSLISYPSYAYLDPGTGSIILQSLLAGIAVALGAARIYWQHIKAFFSFRKPKGENSERNAEQSGDEDPEKPSKI
jgi:hypothetical protein